jgi:hypothetical protein
MPWGNLPYHVVKQFQRLVNPNKEIEVHSAFISDDTIDVRVGRRIENISYVNDRVANRKKNTIGIQESYARVI